MTETMSTQDTRPVPIRLDFESHATGYTRAMGHLDQAATKELDRAGVDARLRELIRIRASQLNGCAYCIDMHSKDARAVGETEQRLYALPAWRETPFFTDRERAGLAWVEAVTLVADTHVPDEVYEAAREHFSEKEIFDMTVVASTINAWNRLAVASRTPAGTYKRPANGVAP